MSSNNNINDATSAIAAAQAAISAAANATSNTNNTNNNGASVSASITRTQSNITANRSPLPSPTDLSSSVAGKPVSQTCSNTGGAYPLPAYLSFVPGGVEYLPSSLYVEGGEDAEKGVVHLNRFGTATTADGSNGGVASGGGGAASMATSPMAASPKANAKRGGLSVDTGASSSFANNNNGPESIIHQALLADATLRKYALHFANNNNKVGHRLPSLSILAEAALVNPLTSVTASQAVQWAEKMILEYMDGRLEDLQQGGLVPKSDEELYTVDTLPDGLNEDAAKLLRRAVIAAWASEEATTGRTPTNIQSPANGGTSIANWPVQQAAQLPTPPLASFLKSLHQLQRGEDPTNNPTGNNSSYTGGPCGYVFRRGDIAWNCRTCQTDATCVLCDQCFHESNHEGHEVFFHTTTPGGCCDCGDREAWRMEGCCARHCPPEFLMGRAGNEEEGVVLCKETEEGGDTDNNDDFEAVRSAKRGRMEHIRLVDGTSPQPSPNATQDPSPLPPRLAAAMGVVIGSVIKSVVTACEGSAIGADVSQWRLKWADEICRLWNGVSVDEEYYRRGAVLHEVANLSSPCVGNVTPPVWTVPEHVLDAANEHYTTELPKKYNLYLRLHNDDVHTFDEVIRALNHKSHKPISVPIGGPGSVGKIGGAGISGAEFNTLSRESFPRSKRSSVEATSPAVETSSTENVVMGDAETSSTTSRGTRSRTPSGDIDMPQPQLRRFRGESTTTQSYNDVNGSSSYNQNSNQSELDPISALVARYDIAQDLTRRVDSDGQVLVRDYQTLDGAGIGFARLRENSGLHCSVVGTAGVEAEERAKVLLEWLSSLLAAHPAVGAMIVQALVDVTDGEDALCTDTETTTTAGVSKGVSVWSSARMIPCWSGTHESWWDKTDECNGGTKRLPAWRRRLDAFPPHLESSYLTRQEGRELFRQGLMSTFADGFIIKTGEFVMSSVQISSFLIVISHASRLLSFISGTDPDFYGNIPYSLPDSRLIKSPHSLWGTLPTAHLSIPNESNFTHPLLKLFSDISDDAMMTEQPGDGNSVFLSQRVFIVDTDLRKHEEGEFLTAAMYPHKMTGLNLVSGVGHVDEYGSVGCRYGESMGVTSKEYAKRIVSCSSFMAPTSPVLTLLLLDPYASKNLRSCLQRLFLSLLTDARFKSRFAASLGAVVYRPTSTLFCAGVGTDADTLLGFTVQLFTTGSLVKALGNLDATKGLLCREDRVDERENSCISALPIAYSVARSIHTNILGATKEVSTLVSNAIEEAKEMEDGPQPSNQKSVSSVSINASMSSLSYQFGSEHPLSTRLAAAPDDKFIDSRCMKHKRLPQLLRDLEYIFETPGTAVKLLSSIRSSSSSTPGLTLDASNDAITPAPSFSSPTVSSNSLATYHIPNALDFPSVWARLLRLGQGIDLQKRRISGGHVEFEDERWLGAFGLSLNLSGTGDALSESPFSSISYNMTDGLITLAPTSAKFSNKEAMGNLFAAFFREIKMWLYREGVLETGNSKRAFRDPGELEALQRSTLHVSAAQLDESSISQMTASGATIADSCDVSCEIGVKNLPEAKLALLEATLLHERIKLSNTAKEQGNSSHGPIMGDWLKIPHSPLAGDCFSFHLPLHRALARSVRCFCLAVVPPDERARNPETWWRLPLLDDDDDFASPDTSSISGGNIFKPDSLSDLVKPTHRSANLRVVWTSGPECSSQEAQLRRLRSRTISSALASTKVVHSLCDHPLRCIAASQQIEHHMWAKNGSSLAGMALNYSSVPLCRSLRDLDLTMVQMSACGFNVGLGARRVFALLSSRFSLDGYLCDPDRRNIFGKMGWSKPPRMQEPEHPELLAESFFTTLCVIVSDLPPPPPKSLNDDSALRQNLRRELLHALAVEPRSYSEAMNAASAAVSRRDESDGGAVGAGGGASSFRSVFTEVLQSIGQQRNQGSRVTGPATFELKPDCSNEYDPSFYHLRKTDHQHAMDTIARLRKQKLSGSSRETKTTMVLPLVAEPPTGHPRFLAARLMLHLPSIYSAIRRYLMYALFSGSWLPPSEPEPLMNHDGVLAVPTPMSLGGPEGVTTRSSLRRGKSEMSSTSNAAAGASFSPETVAASSKSFLEVLQLLTLQVHTLEECSNLHRTLPFLDHEQKSLSSNTNVNSYLQQMIGVPKSLVNVWALLCAPDGPLPSEGSGENRGSVLGLCIALYEHRDNGDNSNRGHKSANDDHGGARTLSSDGLKWLLRFVSALVDGAENVISARESATSGVPITSREDSSIILPEARAKIKRMLANLPDLWPSEQGTSASDVSSPSGMSDKNKEARKAAQVRALAKMKKHQASFAASISSQFNDDSEKKLMDDDENLCIICKCDDDDGGNGPIGYLGHVQRSRVMQLESKALLAKSGCADGLDLNNVYRVVGDKGCQVSLTCSYLGRLMPNMMMAQLSCFFNPFQLRSTESMDSAPVAFLPQGSIVEVLQSKISPQLGLMSRRVLVKHLAPEKQNVSDQTVQGWASMQSWQGYIILSPLSSLCYTNTRWGSTRPIIRQCGHAAHFKCAEAHCLSLFQRNENQQSFDGRFSANIKEGEFLCPLCKQLSNILIPEDNADVSSTSPLALTTPESSSMCEDKEGFEILKSDISSSSSADTSFVKHILLRKLAVSYSDDVSSDEATNQFGSNLLQAMQLSSDGTAQWKKQRRAWDPALRRWDYEENEHDFGDSADIGSCLRLMRQQLISWAAVGHSSAAAEASGRGVRQVVFGEVSFGSVDPWPDYSSKTRDSHPMLLELRRTLTATSNLSDVVTYELGKQLGNDASKAKGEAVSIIGGLISDIVEGNNWMVTSSKSDDQWQVVTSLIASMMCHVSKEDTVAPKVEARAVAAAMWTITGSQRPVSPAQIHNTTMEMDFSSPEVEVDAIGNIGSHDVITATRSHDLSRPAASRTRQLPPKPLSIYRVEKNLGIELDANWGTSDPFEVESCVKDAQQKIPFRPAVASAFLYVPMLAWDLNILAGALFSSLLSNAKSDPCVSSTELLQSAKLLFVARLIQVLSTPKGFALEKSEVDGDDEFDEFEDQCWDDAKKSKEAAAVNKLILLCRQSTDPSFKTTDHGLDDSSLLQNVGNAILPFGRSLVLLLRASTSVMRQRQRRNSNGAATETSADKFAAKLLEDQDTMTIEDGLQLLELMRAPLPSDILQKDPSPSSWISLVNRWLATFAGFEAYNGTRGGGLSYNKITHSWVRVAESNAASNIAETPTLRVKTSAASVEVAQMPKQGEEPRGLQQMNEDEDIAEEFEDESEFGMDEDLEDSDEEFEVLDDMDIDNEGDGFGFDGTRRVTFGLSASSSGDFDDDASDANAALFEPDGSQILGPDDRTFAYVSRSAIIPYQPSISGTISVGPGPRGARGEMFDFNIANRIMKDLSHLGMVHTPGKSMCWHLDVFVSNPREL